MFVYYLYNNISKFTFSVKNCFIISPTPCTYIYIYYVLYTGVYNVCVIYKCLLTYKVKTYIYIIYNKLTEY